MLQARKLAKLEEVVGEGTKEEEPIGPSGDAERQSSGNASLQRSNFLAYNGVTDGNEVETGFTHETCTKLSKE